MKENRLVIYPRPSILQIVSIVFTGIVLLSLAAIGQRIWVLFVVISIIISRSMVQNTFLHRLIITNHEIVDQYLAPWLTRRVPRSRVVAWRVVVHEQFGGVYRFRDSPTQSRTLVLAGADGNTVGEVDLSAFAPRDVERLVAALKKTPSGIA